MKASQLEEMFPHVPKKLIKNIIKGGGSFDECLESVLKIAPEWEPEGVLANILDVSRGEDELTMDLLRSFDMDLESSVSDLCEAFPHLSRDKAREELAKTGNAFEEAAVKLLNESIGHLQMSSGTEDDHVAFLRAMFPEEDKDVLKGMLESMNGKLEDVVDFMLSLDILQRNEEDFDEMRILVEMFPGEDKDKLMAALESCDRDLEAACDLLTGGKDKPKKTKWKKVPLGKGASVGPTNRWDGKNQVVKQAVEPSPFVVVAPTMPQKKDPQQQRTDPSPADYSDHVFSGSRYAIFSSGAGDAPGRMAQLHAEGRRRFSQLATMAYSRGDGDTARRFTALAEKEERLRKMWRERGSSGTSKIDLHGFFVKEAMSVVRSALQALERPGDSVCFVTGRGKNSEGGIPRIKLALIDMVERMPDLSLKVSTGEVVVTKK